MKTGKALLVVVLFILAAVGAWQLKQKPGAAVEVAAGEIQETVEESGPPVLDPVPEIAESTASEMYPFPADTPLLTSTVTMPEKKAPLVYVAYCGDSNDNFTSASQVFGEFFKYQIQQQGTAGLLMNALPNRRLLKTYALSFADRSKQVPYETYLKDAQALNIDLLYCPVFDGTSSEPLVTVKMVDLNSSRTETWSSQQAGIHSINQIITAAAIEALRFAGYPDEVIQKTNLETGGPSDAAFAWYATTANEEMTYENLLAIADSDPDFAYVYSQDGGTTWVGQLIDRGLRKFPNDPRLLTRKATALADLGSTGAMVRYTSELIRRHPDNAFTYFGLADRLNEIFPCKQNAKETPPVYRTMVEQMGLFSEHYSDCYAFAWDHAYALKSLGGYIRSTHTVDKIPSSIWPERQRYINKAYGIMEQLAKGHPDSASIITGYSYYTGDVRRPDVADQRELIKHVAALDPRETEVEVSAASLHSIGYGREKDYFSLIDNALKNHAGDAQALTEIAAALKHELYRQVGWGRMTMDEALRVSNPWLDRFVDAADYVYSTGSNLGFDCDWTYYSVMEKKGNRAKVDEWLKSGQNSYVAALEADQACEQENWDRCVEYARLALPHMEVGEKDHFVRYYMIKSLWKAKRYDECMKESREAMTKYPDKHSFFYTYAVTALESGENLEAGYDCACRLVDLGVTDDDDGPEMKRVYEELRAKLNKPKHPKLLAVVN